MGFWGKFLIIFAIFSICAQASHADFSDDLTSPVTTPALGVTILGTAATIAILFNDEKVSDPSLREPANDRPMGKYSKIGDYSGQMIPNAIYALAMLFAGATGTKHGLRRAEIMTAATLYTAGISSILKVTVCERRPNDGNDRKSFPSGQTATAFAFASVVGAEHGWVPGILAYGLAGTVAYSRMNDNRHYNHDIMAGATIGISYGLGIYYRRKKQSRSRLSISPLMQDGYYGLLANLKF